MYNTLVFMPEKDLIKNKNVVMWLHSSTPEQQRTIVGYKLETYRKFFNKISKEANFFFALDASSYHDGDVFGPVVKSLETDISQSDLSVKADVVYNFGNVPSIGWQADGARVVNRPEFHQLCISKIYTYQQFSQIVPLTILVGNQAEYLSALAKITTSLVVVKPNNGSGGVGVVVVEKQDAVSLEFGSLNGGRAFIIQEFMDTSGGMPKICSSVHDLRLFVIGNKIVFAHLRQPAQGSLISNYHQGGKVTEISIEDLPQAVIDFVDPIKTSVSQKFGNTVNSIDVGFGPDGPFLFEFNSRAGFPWPHFKSLDVFISKLVNYLLLG